MFRIAAMLAGLVLIALPAWFLSGSIPVPQYRKGGLTDYLPMLRQGLAIYGSVLLGVAIYLMRIRLSGQPAFPLELFKAGMYGVLACCIIFFGGGRLYSLAKYGAFDKAIGGNLWGLLVIFGDFSARSSRLVWLCYFMRRQVQADMLARDPEAGGTAMPS